MGLAIDCEDDDAPVPQQTILRLICDGDHGLFKTTPVVRAVQTGEVAPKIGEGK